MEQAPQPNQHPQQDPQRHEYVYPSPEKWKQINDFIHTYMWPFGKQEEVEQIPQVQQQEVGPEQKREQKAAGGTGAMWGGLAGLGGYYLAAWPIGKTIKYLMLTDFGTAKGWETDERAQREFDRGYERGLKKAA